MSARHMLVNRLTRSLQAIFPGFGFGSQKHNHAADFGYPEKIEFVDAYDAYCRNPLAHAAVEKTVGKTWEDNPFLQEFQRDGTEKGNQKETKAEADIRQRFADLRVWQHLAECDRRGLVGGYSGLILRLADSKEGVSIRPVGLPVVEFMEARWEAS